MVKRIGSDLVIARQNVWVRVGNRDLLIHAGEAWAADDPVVTDNPSKFDPVRVHRSVEEPVAEAELEAATTPEPASPPAAPEPSPTAPEPDATATTPEPSVLTSVGTATEAHVGKGMEPAPTTPKASAPKATTKRAGREKTPVTT